ncbi:SEC-C metal-binding domain-containing protein [Cohnella sp. GCM10020058]|uniref:SEC-C metal-binding domain-containing protein n=1 Tax=Cohnella sp. GCM10020058 TaxID=3317330 RepID=UPI00363FDF0D
MNKNISRNDPCPCGSGKKYKNCHLNATDTPTWRDIAQGISFEHPNSDMILKTFGAMMDDFRVRRLRGGCHLLSGIMYVLLNEQGIESDLCIGEVRHPSGAAFDHSWVEILGKAFDVAVQETDDGEQHAAVFAGIDLDTGKASKFNYRHKYKGLDSIGRKALETPLSVYMDGAPRQLGKWGGIESIAKRIGLSVDVTTLQIKYHDVQRKFVDVVNR